MATVATRGLARAKEIYQDRPQRVKELKSEGKTIIGYMCLYPVIEMLTALDLVPYRIFGDMREPITRADNFMPTVVCPFIRSILDVGLKGRYDFLDGAVFSHICDAGAQLPGNWSVNVKRPDQFQFYIDMPHTIHDTAEEHFKEVLRDYRKGLEEFTGKKLTEERLKKAIGVHNEQRALARELYELKKPDPPLLSGVETLQVFKAAMSLPVEEGSQLIREVIDEVKKRKDGPRKKPARLLITGSVIDDTAMVEMIESLENNVVMDDYCVGTRAYFADVPVTDDPIDGLAYHYLIDVRCPRTFRGRSGKGQMKKDYMADLQQRFSYLGDMVRDWKCNGAILEAVRYCDTHAYEVPQLMDYFKSIGVPSIYLEHTYSEAALQPLKTRVQGFLEIIGEADLS